MKKKIASILLLFLLVAGLIAPSVNSFAEKKATEGQNEADVEFYHPTPKKPGEKLPDTDDPKPKELDPIRKMLPQTGERLVSNEVITCGLLLIFLLGFVTFKFKKVGDIDEN